MLLVTENWKEFTNEISTNDDPDFVAVNNALDELDGKSHTMLSLELASGVVLHVGGGPHAYMSQIQNGDSCILAIGSPGKEGIDQLVVGGQPSDFRSSAILSYTQARDILLVFYHGEAVQSTTVKWEMV